MQSGGLPEGEHKNLEKEKGESRMFDKSKVKLGIAPIAWTNDDLPDLGGENTFEQCVSEMAVGSVVACR